MATAATTTPANRRSAVRRTDAAKGSPPIRLAGLVLWSLWLAAAAAGAAETATTSLTTFPNGLRLLVLPRPESATAKVDVYVSLRGAARKPGLAHVVEHLMFCSSAGAPDGSLVDSLAMNVGDFGANTTLARIHLWSGCIPSRLPQALALEADRFARLRPTGDDLETQRRRVLGEFNLHEELYITDALDRRVAAMAYGAGDSTGDPVLGNAGDIDAVTANDVAAFIAESFRPEHTVVMVSGPVTEADVAAIVATGLGALPRTPGAVEPRPLPRPRPRLPAGPRRPTRTSTSSPSASACRAPRPRTWPWRTWPGPSWSARTAARSCSSTGTKPC